MNRRKLRTGLTCATLTLLTFVMISFTSASNPLRDTTVALGRAHYQGFLVKRDRFFPVRESELFALRQIYGQDYTVAERRVWIGGRSTFAGVNENARIDAVATAEDGFERTYVFQSLLQFLPSEPLRHQMEFVTSSGWFEPGIDSTEALPAIIPEEAAAALGITPGQVDRGDVFFTLNGARFRVQAIFRSASLDNLRDLDGDSLLPFDITLVDDVTVAGGATGVGVLAAVDSPRIPARLVVLTPIGEIGIRPVPPSSVRLLSVAVHLPDIPYRVVSQTVEDYLIRVGAPTYYGIDGVAYQGEIRRAMTLSGLVDLIIPLLIAALTVLNTMRGSVYERTSEIYVYNAVGIAPRYIFFMFFAEALVYAVIGALLGYLLSQGVGRILTELGLTGGLSMSYASLATIYASLTITAAVLVSTFFPARDAMRIAAPAENSGWDLPEPEMDDLAFDLPFLFDSHERLAVLEFFDRYLREHGEGSAGHFFCSVPELLIRGPEKDPAPDAPAELVPRVSSTIWLKPFDLGVSQRLTIAIPPDPETGRYKARVTLRRLSGTRDAWTRHNHSFIRHVRRHFLHWRAVPQEDRESMFTIAREKLAAVT